MTDKGMQRLANKLADSIKNELQMMATMNLHAAAQLQRELKRGSIKTFADLHEVMDANELGDIDGLWERMQSEISDVNMELVAGGKMTRQEAEVQTRLDVVNAAQTTVDGWIKNGGLNG